MKSALATVTAAATAAVLLGSLLAAPAAATPSRTSQGTCYLAMFDTAEVIPDAEERTLTLVVSGAKSATNVTIELVPIIYIRQPEYWGIQVLGCTDGIGLPVLTPYVATLDVTHYVGTLGIEVVGAHNSVKIPL
ncbi:MAG: hypothetical protein HKP61_13205 [Dactylosporangium sp.]|nr:hypothetical protein [Dactylosporangium sp.]NNJ61874.1 hypothetical protein [Dactylosporangium sp.]